MVVEVDEEELDKTEVLVKVGEVVEVADEPI